MAVYDFAYRLEERWIKHGNGNYNNTGDSLIGISNGTPEFRKPSDSFWDVG